MHYVYILTSVGDASRHYVGQTADLKERLQRHNAGQVSHTSKYAPWQVETYFGFRDERKAIAFEYYLKSGSGRAFARKHF